MKQVGNKNRENVQRTLSSQAMYLFTEKLGYVLVVVVVMGKSKVQNRHCKKLEAY